MRHTTSKMWVPTGLAVAFAAFSSLGLAAAPDPNVAATTPLISSVQLKSVPAPGAPPPEPTQAPAAVYQPAGPLFGYVETLTAGEPSKYGFVGNPVCAISGIFQRGNRIVWRFQLLDTASRNFITDKSGETVNLVLPDGTLLPAQFGERGAGMVPNAPWQWFAVWDVPQDYPLGSLPYKVQVTTADGTVEQWSPPTLLGVQIVA